MNIKYLLNEIFKLFWVLKSMQRFKINYSVNFYTRKKIIDQYKCKLSIKYLLNVTFEIFLSLKSMQRNIKTSRVPKTTQKICQLNFPGSFDQL